MQQVRTRKQEAKVLKSESDDDDDPQVGGRWTVVVVSVLRC